MVTYSDPTFAMIRSRIENIEEIQRKIFKCLHESEAQLQQISLLYADKDAPSDTCILTHQQKIRVVAKHHGWQWLLGRANVNDKIIGPGKQIEISVMFDDILVEKTVSQNEVIDVHGYKIIDLEIGMKVLAEYNHNDAPGVYYTASVAEIPEEQNRYRYLLLFDDGTAGYVIGDQCFICPDQSFISSVNPVHKRFIQYYNRMYQEGGFKILDLSLQSTILTEINGQWRALSY
ncbi:histone-lysine N-methyltransferase SETDB1-like [Bolinopsis microptera]|uniref:histone-lysine N-methyltransferase SETDB1-like n=1 Tax=Bolinopsis microptera TaxID=2820187 RepID=UPI003079BCDC